jgi:hypothetical protein
MRREVMTFGVFRIGNKVIVKIMGYESDLLLTIQIYGLIHG